MNPDSVMPKTKLENIKKKRAQAQEQINRINEQAQLLQQQAMLNYSNQQEINNIGEQGEELINQYLGNQVTA